MQVIQGRRATVRARIRPQLGFTLIELMVTIAIFAILMAIAAPAFQDAVLGSKLRGYANDLVASTFLARGEAIKRNTQVTMCASSDGATCTTGGWQQGWIVAVGTTIIQKQQALENAFHANGSVSTITFQPTGIGSTQGTVTFCRAAPTVGRQERVVTISATGRPTVTKTESGTCS